jgi:20S proteasome alpha/beta subunit
MYYNRGKGAVIASDSRVMLGSDYSTAQKIFEIMDGVFFSASGLSGIIDELIETIKGAVEAGEIRNLMELRRTLEQQVRELFYWYKNTEKPSFSKDEVLIEGILGGVHNGRPRLFIVHEYGYAEPYNSGFRAIGDGSRHAYNMLRNLYKEDISKERAMEIAVYAIIQTSKIDSVVDDNPQIAIIEAEVSKFLNAEQNNFVLSTPEIKKIKQRINGIEENRSLVFEVLLDGPEDIKKELNEVLEKYRNRVIAASQD